MSIESWLTPPEDWEPDNPYRYLEWADGQAFKVIFWILMVGVGMAAIAFSLMIYILIR